MGEISRFHGIVIRMYYRDHAPPHFHAVKAEFDVAVELRPLRLRRGVLPARDRRLVLKWAAGHLEELLADWALVQRGVPPTRIDPSE
jgi:uncharacterized protein DUF4160